VEIKALFSEMRGYFLQIRRNPAIRFDRAALGQIFDLAVQAREQMSYSFLRETVGIYADMPLQDDAIARNARKLEDIRKILEIAKTELGGAFEKHAAAAPASASAPAAEPPKP
jgi:hypothetical protein